MKRGRTYDWIPLWIDKWLWGSTRHELMPAERSIWIDLMVLAAKDDGNIRANETTGYPTPQLAGMFCVSIEELESTIEKCIEHGKLKKLGNGILFIINWKEYSLSLRHKKRVMSRLPGHGVTLNGPPYKSMSPYRSKSKSSSKNKEKEKIDLTGGFDKFWSFYPKRVHKQDAQAAYAALIRAGTKDEEITAAVDGYKNLLFDQALDRGREMREHLEFAMHPASFLRRNKWRDYVGIKRKLR